MQISWKQGVWDKVGRMIRKDTLTILQPPMKLEGYMDVKT
jgi:hypothetical protein